MKNLISKSFVVFLFVVLTSSLFAQPGGMMQEKRGQICKLMNLTDNQIQKIQKLKIEHQEYIIDLRTVIQKNRLAIKKIMLKDNFNEADFLNLSRKNSDLRAKIHDSRLKMQLGIYKLLNTDQKKIWKTKFLKMEKKGHKGCKGIKRGMSKKFHKRLKRF